MPLCQRGSLSVNNQASSNPASTVSAAAMRYVSSVGAPQLNAQQGEIHLAAYKLIEMQREALWNLYRLSPPMELSSENCVTLSAFTAPTVWCTLSTRHCSLRFVSERVCVCVPVHKKWNALVINLSDCTCVFLAVVNPCVLPLIYIKSPEETNRPPSPSLSPRFFSLQYVFRPCGFSMRVLLEVPLQTEPLSSGTCR